MGCSCLFRSPRRRNPVEQHFLRNGALFLEKQIAFAGNNANPIKIFTAEEIQIAISSNQILSCVSFDDPLYKGVLDEQIVAIKKYGKEDGDPVSDDPPYKRVLDGQIVFLKKHGKNNLDDDEFTDMVLNMVIIQSQVVHRNVVKVLGCCLETRIPCVVYEFIPNRSLFDHLHEHDDQILPWEKRLSIAMGTAEALAYLHTAGPRCIVHRDVKSTSILLDHNYTPKISNFELSTSLTIDQRPVEDAVTGTWGYLDPEYAVTGQFTEKSDVYGFGVVLAELLTGKKPFEIVPDGPCNVLNIGPYLKLHIEDKCLGMVLETTIFEEGRIEQLEATAKLAVRCLQEKGVERPTMKEVALELKRIT